jgi:hypothetical protein
MLGIWPLSLRDPKATQVIPAHKAILALREIPVTLARKAIRETKALRAIKAFPVTKETKATLGLLECKVTPEWGLVIRVHGTAQRMVIMSTMTLLHIMVHHIFV